MFLYLKILWVKFNKMDKRIVNLYELKNLYVFDLYDCYEKYKNKRIINIIYVKFFWIVIINS